MNSKQEWGCAMGNAAVKCVFRLSVSTAVFCFAGAAYCQVYWTGAGANANIENNDNWSASFQTRDAHVFADGTNRNEVLVDRPSWSRNLDMNYIMDFCGDSFSLSGTGNLRLLAGLSVNTDKIASILRNASKMPQRGW